MTDEQTPQPTSFPPPPSATVPPPASATQAHAKRRNTGFIVGAVVAVLVVVGGLIAFNLPAGDTGSASAQPLALAFTPGETETFTIHMTMDGQMEAGELLGSQPIVMDVTQTVTWEVVSVDDDGIATVNVTVDEMTGTMNGVEIPDASAGPPTQMRIAPDGRILSAGGMSFAGAGQTGGASFPGMGQMTPLLPDEPVEPGNSWTKDFSQEVPFGEGTIEFTATSTLERYEDVDGVNAAVITTEFTVPMDFTIDFGELLGAMAGAEGVPAGATGFEDATITYGGEGRIRQTAWVDPEAKQMLEMTSSGTFDMTMEFGGLDVFEGQTIGFTGDFTQDLARG